MKYIINLFLVIGVLFVGVAQADSLLPGAFGQQSAFGRSVGNSSPMALQPKLAEMNGIAFKDVVGFWKTWHLVTVRYRTDTKEMRLIYANDIAWKQIESDRSKGVEFPTEYPDGAAFGKTPFSMKQDELFESSLMPDKSWRYQVMVKDSKKYADTHGWGYAIFDNHGNADIPPNDLNCRARNNCLSNDEGVRQVTSACAICHDQAPSRGFVFIGHLNAEPNQDVAKKFHMTDKKFETFGVVEREKLAWSSKFKRERKSEFGHEFDFLDAKFINVFEQPAESMFMGTMNESTPLLIKRLKVSKLPSVMISSDRKMWVVAYKDPDSFDCVLTKARMIQSSISKGMYNEMIYNNRVCE